MHQGYYTLFGISVISSGVRLDLSPYKPIRWVGAREEIKRLPKPVRREIILAMAGYEQRVTGTKTRWTYGRELR
jgi:phage-related protein